MPTVSIRTARVRRMCSNARHWETDHTINPGEPYTRRVAFPGDEGNELRSGPWVLNQCSTCTPTVAASTDPAGDCVRCGTTASAGVCCSSHGKQLCHLCYRRTHFVELCVAGCIECAAEGLPVNLSDLKTTAGVA